MSTAKRISTGQLLKKVHLLEKKLVAEHGRKVRNRKVEIQLFSQIKSLRRQLTSLVASKGKKTAKPTIKVFGSTGLGADPESTNVLGVIATLATLTEKLSYAKAHLKKIGEGSNRIVYSYKTYVVKFGKNRFGVASNKFEYQFYKNHSHWPLAKVLATAKDSSFILMERLTQATPKGFLKRIGVVWQDFYKWLDYNYLVSRGKFSLLLIRDESTVILDKSEFAQKILSIALKTDLARGDLGRVTSYGADKAEKLKLLDYGSTGDMIVSRRKGAFSD